MRVYQKHTYTLYELPKNPGDRIHEKIQNAINQVKTKSSLLRIREYVRSATRLGYIWYTHTMVCILIRTSADLTFLFFSSDMRYQVHNLFTYLVYDLFQLLYYLLFFVFPPDLIFRSRVIGTCPVTTNCIVAMS